MKTFLALVVVLAAACGSKSTPAPTTASNKEMGKPNMPAEVVKFHDVLAPKWHAEKGEQRMKDTCAAMGEFQVSAEAIAKATPPQGSDPMAWEKGSKELTDAVTALDTTCKSNDATAFEPAFENVHNRFHAVMETSMAGHGMEGGKSEEMHKDGEQCDHDKDMHGEHMKGEHGEHMNGEAGEHKH